MSKLNQVKRKAVKVVLSDGKEREIKFTLNAMAELEDKYGSVEEAFKQLEKGSIKAIRFMLWASIIDEDEDLTEKQIGNLIDMNSIKEIMDALNSASDQDMPQVEDVKDNLTVIDGGIVEGTVVPN